MTTCFELLIPSYRGRDEDGISNVNLKNDQANGAIKDTTDDNNPDNPTEIHDTGTQEGLSNSVAYSPSNQKVDKGMLYATIISVPFLLLTCQITNTIKPSYVCVYS